MSTPTLTPHELAMELRMLQDANRIDWRLPPTELVVRVLGVSLPSWEEWAMMPWFGPIDPWLRPTATASDVLVDPHGAISITDRGQRLPHVLWLHPDWIAWLQTVIGIRSAALSATDPNHWRDGTHAETYVIEGSFTLPDGRRRVRYSCTRPPYTPAGRSISLRILHGTTWTLNDLVREHILPEAAAAMIRTAIMRGVSIIIGGATGSGKTTLVGALLREVQEMQRRVIIIEDTRELPDPDHGFAVDAHRSGETFAACVRRALRQYPSMIVIGEIRGDEALAMLEAAATGHPGISTIHATDVRSILTNLERLAARRADIRPDYVRSMICSTSVPLLAIFVRNRRVRDIVEVLPIASSRLGDTIPLNPLWTWNEQTMSLEPQYPPQGTWYH